ncbi:MAG: hypothetical protein P8013_15010 [Candidatus Sulfobium sp.]
MKQNCWEFNGCGKQRKGRKDSIFNCPVPGMTTANGINGGKNAGRVCWLIANTLCKGENATTFEDMIKTCTECEFYKLVMEEEGKELILSIDMLREAYKKTKALESNQQSRHNR